MLQVKIETIESEHMLYCRQSLEIILTLLISYTYTCLNTHTHRHTYTSQLAQFLSESVLGPVCHLCSQLVHWPSRVYVCVCLSSCRGPVPWHTVTCPHPVPYTAASTHLPIQPIYTVMVHLCHTHNSGLVG